MRVFSVLSAIGLWLAACTATTSPPMNCETLNGGCEQLCTMEMGDVLCGCEAGYGLADDGVLCEDVDECDDPAACVHGSCTNTPGEYACDCDAPWLGPACDQCPAGLGGDGCEHLDGTVAPEVLRVRVDKAGVPRTLALRRYTVRADEALPVKVVGPDGEVTQLTVEAKTRGYRGYCEEEPDGVVAAMLLPSGALRYDVFKGDPKTDWRHVPAEESDPSATSEITYTILHEPAPNPAGVPLEGATFTAPNAYGGPFYGTAYRVHMAFIISKNYLDTLGYTDLHRVIRKAENTIARMNAVYLRDVLIELHISHVLIRQDVMTDWEGGRADILSHFPDATPNSVFTVTDEFGSGLAYVCMLAGPQPTPAVDPWATSKVGPTDEDGTWYGVMRHEFGHSLGSGHYEGGSPEGPTIMSGNALSRFSSYEVLAIMGCRDTYGGSADRFAEVLGTYEETNVAPYARLDDGLVHPAAGGDLFIDVLANDHDTNGHGIAIGGFEAISALGGTVTLAPGTGPSGRDQLVYSPPDLQSEGVFIADCGAGELLSAADCETCEDSVITGSSCAETAECGESAICVGGVCRHVFGCGHGALVDACGQPCPGGDLLLWLDADDMANLESLSGDTGHGLPHGAELARWYDRSGRGHDAVTYTEGYAPVVEMTGEHMIGERPTVHFTQDFMEIRGLDIGGETRPAITSVAMARFVNGGVHPIWVQLQNGFNKREHNTLGAAGVTAGVSSVVYDLTEAGPLQWYNGVHQSAGGHPEEPAGPSIALGALLYAAEGYEGAYHNELVLGELLVFERTLGELERRQIEAYLMAKWQVELQDQFLYTTVDAGGLAHRGPVQIDLE